jgi:hypothetical protein
MREVLQDEDRQDTSERRVREAERRADVVHLEGRVNLVARGSSPRNLDHASRPVDTDDVITAPRQCERMRARSAAQVGTGPGGATTFANSSAVRSTSSRCSGSSRRRAQAALSRSYMKRRTSAGLAWRRRYAFGEDSSTAPD